MKEAQTQHREEAVMMLKLKYKSRASEFLHYTDSLLKISA